ncbi:alanine racemase, partial [candidate division GN15 bacterium]|nr:alanine racemase [candidate division GN15 bacterium]
METPDNTRHLSWIELSQAAFRRNIDSLTHLARGRLLAASVKANAYGHGLPEVVQMFNELGKVDYLTVHSLEEAAVCRRVGWERPIMILGPIPRASAEAVLEFNVEPVVTSREILTKLGQISKKHDRRIKTHLKLETGTNRQGVTESELERYAKIYHKYPQLRGPYGAATHFANIEDTTRHDYAQFQLANFNRMTRRMVDLQIKPTLRHTASSAATILFEKTHFDMVRPGISVYGYWPSKETYLSYRLKGGSNDLFVPPLSWKTRVTQIKRLEPDSFVGYGCTYRTSAESKIAVLPVGYYDGYDRALSNRAYVLINGRRAPVR